MVDQSLTSTAITDITAANQVGKISRVRGRLIRAGFQVAAVQAIIQNPGDHITDDALTGANINLEEVGEALQTALAVLQLSA